MAAFGLVLRQVDRCDARHLGSTEAGGDFKTLVPPDGHHVAAFQRRGGACQHDREAFELAAHHRNVARMIANAIFLLETDFMRFIDDDKPRIGEGKEQRRSGTRHYLHPPLCHPAPDAAALRLLHARMPGCRLNAKARFKTLQKGLGQGNFGKKDKYLLSILQSFCNRLEIGFGFTRTGDSIKHNGLKLPCLYRITHHFSGGFLKVG